MQPHACYQAQVKDYSSLRSRFGDSALTSFILHSLLHLPCLTFSFTYLLLPTESPRRETPAVKRNSFNTSSFRNGCSSFYANEYNTTCFTGYAIEFLFSAESPLGLCGFPTPPRLHSQTTILGLSTVCRPVHACAPRQRENSE